MWASDIKDANGKPIFVGRTKRIGKRKRRRRRLFLIQRAVCSRLVSAWRAA